MNDTLEAKILIVDDDEIDIRAVKRGLSKAGITNTIVEARDGIEALEIMRGTDEKEALAEPYIVLLDLNMPRMGGLDFLRELRKDAALHHHVVFVLTTSDLDRDQAAAYEMIIAGYITKQDAGRDFVNLVHMLERFLITVRLPTPRAPVDG